MRKEDFIVPAVVVLGALAIWYFTIDSRTVKKAVDIPQIRTKEFPPGQYSVEYKETSPEGKDERSQQDPQTKSTP